MFANATTAVSLPDRHPARPRARLPLPESPVVGDPRRHLSRRGFGGVVRRDQRRFGRAMVRNAPVPSIATRRSDGLRLFAHTFGAAFLFVTVFIA